MTNRDIGGLLPLIVLNAAVVVAFVIMGITLEFPLWLMVIFVIAEASVSRMIVQRLSRRD